MAARSFGKYTVIRPLGHGGMAAVFQAQDPDLDRPVAIKVIHAYLALDPQLGERFRREARLVASLRHPHIVQVHDFGVADDQPFMVMEYLDGGTLKDRLAAGRASNLTWEPVQVLRLLQDLASALDYAHGRGAVHRDIKPGNILFAATGEPVLTDFGIAKLLDELTQLSNTGSIIGTPVYMSPEQASGKVVDHRSDIYSLAIVVYEMLAGRAPFVGESATTLLLKQVSEPPPPLGQFRPGLVPELESVMARGLAKDPDQRFASAGEFALAFAEAIGAEAPARPARPEASEEPTVIESLRATSAAAAPSGPAPGTGPSGPAASRLNAESSRPGRPAPGSPVERRRPGRGPLVVAGVLALVVVAALAAGFLWLRPLARAGPPAGQTSVRLAFRDAAARGRVDQVTLAGAGLPVPTAGHEYEAWLLGGGDQRRRDIGPLRVSGSGVEFTYSDPDGANLLANFEGVEITSEVVGRPANALPSTEVILRGSLPQGALVHIRHLLVPGTDGPHGGAYAQGLVAQAQVLVHLSDLLRSAQAARDLNGVTYVAEGMANVIAGPGAASYGDANGDGIINDRGDGAGLLPAGDRPGYIQAVLNHARLAAGQPDATASVKLHAGHVQIAAANVNEWAGQLETLTLNIAHARDLNAVADQVQGATGLANRLLNGQDLNGNEVVEPIAGEGGALIVLEHAQLMAGVALGAPDR